MHENRKHIMLKSSITLTNSIHTTHMFKTTYNYPKRKISIKVYYKICNTHFIFFALLLKCCKPIPND